MEKKGEKQTAEIHFENPNTTEQLQQALAELLIQKLLEEPVMRVDYPALS